MIRVSKAAGSEEFAPLLKRLGAPCQLRTLRQMPFADFAFTGNGPLGLCAVGIERKTVSEIVGSLSNKRFRGWQLRGLLRSYDYVFVIVEGYAHVDAQSGELMQGKFSAGFSRFRHAYMDVMKFELTLRLKASCIIIHTKNKAETAWLVRSIYDWFTRKKWHEHKAAYAIFESLPDRLIVEPQQLKRRIAAQFDQVEWVRSRSVDQYFRSIKQMINATAAEWEEALGDKRQRVYAKRIYDIIRQEDEGDPYARQSTRRRTAAMGSRMGAGQVPQGRSR